jgi:phosphate-selective porin OprO/OprP
MKLLWSILPLSMVLSIADGVRAQTPPPPPPAPAPTAVAPPPPAPASPAPAPTTPAPSTTTPWPEPSAPLPPPAAVTPIPAPSAAPYTTAAAPLVIPPSEPPPPVAPSGAATVSVLPPTTAESLASRGTPTATGGPGNPASVAAGPGGFRITALDDRAEIRFRALVQADGRFWFDDTQRPTNSTFLIRRAYLWVEGRLPYGMYFMLNPDFGGGTVVLQDAYIGWNLHEALKFQFGKFKPPFGLERLQPTSNLSFVEFGLPTLLTPNRDVGAMVHGDVLRLPGWRAGLAGYAAGVFNGVPDNASGDLDGDNQKEFAGRVYLRPFIPVRDEVLGRLFVGVATTFGRDYGTATTPFGNPTANVAYKTPGQNTDFSYVAAATGVTPTFANTAVANGPHNRYGAYLYEALGPFSLMGEYYVSNQEVGLAGKGNATISNKAYQAQATLVLFGADASYDFVHVKTPFEPLAGHFGALELAARAGHIAFDPNAFPTYASPTASVRGATEVTGGVNWYLSDNGKFVVNWDHTEFQGGAKTAPELSAGHREAENIILVRAQVVY